MRPHDQQAGTIIINKQMIVIMKSSVANLIENVLPSKPQQKDSTGRYINHAGNHSIQSNGEIGEYQKNRINTVFSPPGTKLELQKNKSAAEQGNRSTVVVVIRRRSSYHCHTYLNITMLLTPTPYHNNNSKSLFLWFPTARSILLNPNYVFSLFPSLRYIYKTGFQLAVHTTHDNARLPLHGRQREQTEALIRARGINFIHFWSKVTVK